MLTFRPLEARAAHRHFVNVCLDKNRRSVCHLSIRHERTEGELLERAPGGLGEEEPDEDDFEEEEDAVADVILPACRVERVNVSFLLEPARRG